VTERIPYFSSGVGLPDVTVLDSEMLTNAGRGIRMLGDFGMDGGFESGEFVWRD
jgi:hypothetical protein